MAKLNGDFKACRPFVSLNERVLGESNNKVARMNLLAAAISALLGGQVLVAHAVVVTVINAGEVVDNATVANDNQMQVYGTSNNTTIEAGGNQYVALPGVSNNTIVKSGGLQFADIGGILNGTVVESGGVVAAGEAGSQANNTEVKAGGILGVTLNALARETIVDGNFLLADGGQAEETTINDGGVMNVSSGSNISLAQDTQVNSGGLLQLSSGGTAARTVIEAGGKSIVDAGTTSTDITLKSGGVLQTSTGATTSGTHVNGSFSTSAADNTATNFLAELGSQLDVLDGGTATDTTIRDGGTVTVAATGQIAGRTLVTGSGVLQTSGSLTNIGELVLDMSGDQTLTYTLEGAGGLTKQGANAITLQPVNGYTGNTQVDAGTLLMGGENSIANSQRVTINAGATLSQNGYAQTLNSLSGSGTLDMAGAAVTLNNQADANSTFSGEISGGSGLTKTGAGALTLDGQLLWTGTTQINEGELILDGANGGGRLTGTIVGVSGSALTLRNAAYFQGGIDPLGVSIDSTSSWDMTTNSLVDNLTLAGQITMTPPSAPGTFKSLTMANLSGQNGLVVLNTATGGSAVGSDKLVIDGGTVTGKTRLSINEISNAGLATDGNGILVVEAINGATTTAQTSKDGFALNEPVYAGAYEYRLFAADAQGSGENWYLRNYMSETVDPGFPVEPNPPGGGLPGLTLYRPEVALLPASMDLFSEMLLSSVGERYERRSDEGTTAQASRGLWARALGGWPERYGTGDTKVTSDSQIGGFQLGHDLWAYQGADGSSNVAGVYAAVTHGTSDVKGFVGGKQDANAGSLTNDAYSVAAYFTRTEASGFYTDLVLQYSWFDGETRSYRDYDVEGDGITASVEVGYPIEISSNFTLEPQAQVIYQKLDFDTVELQKTRVELDADDRINSRLGVRGVWNFTTASGSQVRPFVKANVWNQSGGDTTSTYGLGSHRVELDNSFADTSLELGAGLTAQLSNTVSVYGQASYQQSLDSQSNDDTQMMVGLNWRF